MLLAVKFMLFLSVYSWSCICKFEGSTGPIIVQQIVCIALAILYTVVHGFILPKLMLCTVVAKGTWMIQWLSTALVVLQTIVGNWPRLNWAYNLSLCLSNIYALFIKHICIRLASWREPHPVCRSPSLPTYVADMGLVLLGGPNSTQGCI